MTQFLKFVPITKVDEAKREVGGIVTAEVPDKLKEVCHYASTKPYYVEWSTELANATEGKNLGNLRVMHGLTAAGVGKALLFDDTKKQIVMTFKVVDDAAWKGVQEGMYTGFSQGGDYVTKWEAEDGLIWYTAKPSEVSLVDNPALGIAHFDFVRADGTVEIRKFLKQQRSEPMEPVAVSAEPVSSPSPQLSPEIMDGIVKKASESVLAKLKKEKESLAREAEIRKSLHKRCTAILEKKFADGGMEKGMYEVGRFADVLCDLAWIRISADYEREYEGDESTLPEDLQRDLEQLATSFLAMAAEETKELVIAADEAGKSGGLFMSLKTTDLAKAAQSASGIIQKMSKAVSDHHDKMSKLHKAHADEMSEHCAKLTKVLGGESDQPNAADAGDGDRGSVVALDPASGAAPNIQHAAAPSSMTAEQIQAEIASGIEKGIQTILKSLSEAEETEKPTSAAQPGIGKRSDLPTVASNGGPAIRVMPVRKADDSRDPEATATGIAKEPVSREDVSKAMNGDKSAALRLMGKSTRSDSVPQVVADQFNKRA